jgi:hypothetical protein
MTLVIPEPLLHRLQAYPEEWTGKIILNVHKGTVGSADLQEHISASSKKSLDSVGEVCHRERDHR